jgi:hypothetical protein
LHKIVNTARERERERERALTTGNRSAQEAKYIRATD